MPAPLIEFAQFAQPHRWWLRYGPPPWLEDDRWWVRAFRASLMLGLVGAASGWVSVGGLFLVNFLDEAFGGTIRWLTEGGLGILCGPGFYFGVVTLVPLSRWLGRGWIMSLLAVPVSMFASYCGVMTLLFVSPIMSNSSPDWIPGGKDAAGFYAGLVGAAIVAVWMGHPLRYSAWFAGVTAALLAGLVCGSYFLVSPQWNSSVIPGEIREILNIGSLYAGFQSVTAAGLGIRLWWKQEVHGRGGTGVRGKMPDSVSEPLFRV